MRRVLRGIDEHIACNGLKSEVDAPDVPPSVGPVEETTHIHLAEQGIQTVVWATGFTRSYPWPKVPALDQQGEIIQRRGVTRVPGLYVLGQRFQHRRDSSFIDGVRHDAEHLADLIAVRRPRRAWMPGRNLMLTSSLTKGETASRSRKITQHDIELFTEITGDRNPLHYDVGRASGVASAASSCREVITSGLLNAVVAEELPGPGSVFLHVDWRFLRPVRPGDVITAEVEVLEVRTDKPIVTLRTTITNQEGTVVLDGQATVYQEHLI